MANKVSVSLDTQFLKRSQSYVRRIDRLYALAIKEAANLALSISDYNPELPFTWNSYPQTKARIDKIVKSLHENIVVSVNAATRKEWLEACKANDKIAKQFFNNPKLKSIKLDHYYQRNLEALESFQIRKSKGLDLSTRIWNYTDQFKSDLEMCLDLGLGEGKSAAELSRDVRQYLNEPKKLFRRIKDKETGQYYLSQNAQKYNPGSGQYRSSYKNALRLTRTETNMAYRMSDMERWEQMDFVVGYEVLRSNNKYSCPVCMALVGKYPKSFKWAGWHPQCRCKCIAILATPDEFLTYQKKILNDEDPGILISKNEVKEMPEVFKVWVASNQQRISKAASIPYFLDDNKDLLKKELKLAI
ncbi:MAG: hypothetical protein ACK5M3_05510 [Dysgonomonas sp.]